MSKLNIQEIRKLLECIEYSKMNIRDGCNSYSGKLESLKELDDIMDKLREQRDKIKNKENK